MDYAAVLGVALSEKVGEAFGLRPITREDEHLCLPEEATHLLVLDDVVFPVRRRFHTTDRTALAFWIQAKSTGGVDCSGRCTGRAYKMSELLGFLHQMLPLTTAGACVQSFVECG